MWKVLLTMAVIVVLSTNDATAQAMGPARADGQVQGKGYCYAEYSSPDGKKMFTLMAGEKRIEDCRRFHWIPFRITFFAGCPNCKMDREDFLTRLSDRLHLIAEGQPAGWPYEIKGGLRMWYGGKVGRDDALKACRDHANEWLAQHVGSKLICIK